MRLNGAVSDWTTQRWVQLTGRRVCVERDAPWLDGPVGDVERIGADFFERYAERAGLSLDRSTPGRGLLPRFSELSGVRFDASRIASEVHEFYEHTSSYELDVWSRWSGAFEPFGGALAAIFSRRLEQLNVPLSSLDTSRGITSEVMRLLGPEPGASKTAWVRTLRSSGRTLYAGCYSLCTMPGFEGRCVRVCFPLPNGHATVVMWPEVGDDGSLSLYSEGERFGDPGFYFYVERGEGEGWARYVRSFRETIRVYLDEERALRTDHQLRLFGARVLELHYRMRKLADQCN